MPPRRTRRVLLVYAVPYSGHAHAAAALREALEATGKIEVEEYHFLQQFKVAGAAVVRFYKWLLKYVPSVWGHLHDNPDYHSIADTIASGIQEWDIVGLLDRVESWQPDLVVAIQAFPLRILAEAKRQGRLRVPLVVVTTDFWAHRYWAHPSVDHYFVSTKRAQQDLKRQHIPLRRISCTGIPLRPDFSLPESRLPTRTQARTKLGLPQHLPIVLCLGGGYGFVPFAELLPLIEAEQTPRYWVMLFGKNTAGLEDARRLLRVSNARDRIALYGFREDMCLFMRASDVCVTKPGGLSSSEALVCRLPLILYRPLPGQEQKNVDYLVKAGVAKRARTVSDVFRAVHVLTTQSSKRRLMMKQAQVLARPGAAKAITNMMMAKFLGL